MPLFTGPENIGRNLRTLQKEGFPRKQALAIALQKAREKRKKRKKKK